MIRISVGVGVVSMLAALTSVAGGCVSQLGEETVRTRGGGGPALADDVEALPADGDNLVIGDDDREEAAAPLPAWDRSLRFQGARDGRIAGTFGTINDVDAAMDIVHVFDDGYYTEIETFGLRSDGRRVMIRLQVDSVTGQGFFEPGIGKRLALGPTSAGNVGALACEGPDSGDTDEPFEDTPFDEEPCEISVDTEQDPDAPQALRVTVQATFADADGNCPAAPGGGGGFHGEPGEPDGDFGEEDLPDFDGDGDGDLPCDDDAPGADGPGVGTPEPDEQGGDGEFHPLATSTFTMTR